MDNFQKELIAELEAYAKEHQPEEYKKFKQGTSSTDDSALRQMIGVKDPNDNIAKLKEYFGVK